MPIDHATTQKIIAHLQKTWGVRTCPMCGFNKWSIEGHVTLTVGAAPGQMFIGGPSLPCAAIICQVCGNTVLLNLVVAGVVAPNG